VASATEGQMRLISAVMGGRTYKGRETESKKLLTWGFRFFETVNPLKAVKSLLLNRPGLVTRSCFAGRG
jgi:D-alanyl-D-alanine carboxypeptidase (penicillin-binding protein 5/6)